jgi:hypothetical protein
MARMKVTPHGFWRHGKDFLSAADAVKPPSELKRKMDGVSMVAYYLVGHSIELTLKSYLFAKGYKLKDLRDPKKYGHSLSNLLNECRKRKIGREVKLSNAEIAVIHLLNDVYKTKRFEYLEYGMYRLPGYLFTRDVAEKLVNGLSKYAMNPPFNKSKQSDALKARASVLSVRSTHNRRSI